jgi:hypothetical protein
MWNTSPRGNVFTTGSGERGGTVPSGELGSSDKSKLRERERETERKRSQLCVQGGLTEGERTLRDDWPVVDGSWRRSGEEELPCELVREWWFLGSGVP